MEKPIRSDAVVNNEMPLAERLGQHRLGQDRPIDDTDESARLRGLHTKTEGDVNADRDYTRADTQVNPLIAKAHADGEQAAEDAEDQDELEKGSTNARSKAKKK